MEPARTLACFEVELERADAPLARFLDAYLFVTEDVTTQTTWYRLADGSIGVCADDEEALETQARDAVDDIGQSLLSLDLRSRTFAPGSSSSEIVTLAVDAFEEIRDAVGIGCVRTQLLEVDDLAVPADRGVGGDRVE